MNLINFFRSLKKRKNKDNVNTDGANATQVAENDDEQRKRVLDIYQRLCSNNLYTIKREVQGLGGYYTYDNAVWEALGEIRKKYPDLQQYKNHLKDTAFEKLSKQQIAEQFLFWSRGERFCDGTIAGAIDEGSFVKLFMLFFDLQTVDSKNTQKDKE